MRANAYREPPPRSCFIAIGIIVGAVVGMIEFTKEKYTTQVKQSVTNRTLIG